MKKVLLSLTLLLFLVSCKKIEPVVPFKPFFEVYALFPASGFGDRGFMDLVYQGIEEASLVNDFRINYIVPESTEAGIEWISKIAALKSYYRSSALIIISGGEYGPAINALNGSYGPHKILYLDTGVLEQEGLATLTYRAYAPSYLAGYLSASQVKNCRAVMIEPFDSPYLKDHQAGFSDGVKDAGGTVSPTVFLSTGYDGYEMIDSAYVLTGSLLKDHELIYAMTSGSNIGIINAVRGFPEKRYVVGVDSDQSWMGLSVVTGSVVFRIEEDVKDFISLFAEGNFFSGLHQRTLADGRTEFLINTRVLGIAPIPQSQINIAIKKERGY